MAHSDAGASPPSGKWAFVIRHFAQFWHRPLRAFRIPLPKLCDPAAKHWVFRATAYNSTRSRKVVVVEHHSFQTICPNGQLLIEPEGTLCPGTRGWLASNRLWLLTFVRRFLCSHASASGEFVVESTRVFRSLVPAASPEPGNVTV
jgi:hypothetical protein